MLNRLKNRLFYGRNNWKLENMDNSLNGFSWDGEKLVSKSNYEMVKEFHQIFAHKTPDTLQQVEDFGMRLRLICEEFKEVIKAYNEKDIVKVAKELSDLLYVTYGGMIDLGIPEEVFTAVHKSNMSKLGEDGKPIYREDGKVLKGPNFVPAEKEIKKVLGI